MNDKQIEEIISQYKTLAQNIREGIMDLTNQDITNIVTILQMCLQYCDSRPHNDIVSKANELLHKIQAENDRELCANLLVSFAERIQKFYEKSLFYYREIVDAYNNGSLDQEFINTHTYQNLVQVKQRDVELFQIISRHVFNINLKRIQKKHKLKVTFFLKDSAEWSCEELYKKFAASPDIEVNIVAAPFLLGTPKSILDTYAHTLSYFKNRGMDVIGLYDTEGEQYLSWESIGKPDILFLLNPHYTAFQSTADICQFPLSVLNVYIPYGILFYGNVEHQFNQMSHMLCWKIFCESSIHKELAKKYSDIGDSNVVESGYVKMDSFYKESHIDESKLWKVQDGVDKSMVKRIIYAPHYSIKSGWAGFGNFDKIYKQMYEYAKGHASTTSWVIRPHPMLMSQCVSEGIFKSEQEYEDYLQMWEDLPNAHVNTEGMYIDLFITSDAMILDSISFLSEYLYAHKPMLFLTRERQTFNEYGQKVRDILYKVDGGDFDGICQFIEQVVIQEKDVMRDERERFFSENLDYVNKRQSLASDFIFHYIENHWKGSEIK